MARVAVGLTKTVKKFYLMKTEVYKCAVGLSKAHQ